MPTRNEAAYQALTKKYAKALIAEWAGISRQALTRWNTVPSNRVADIAKASGLSPEELRPEPYAVD